MMLEMFRDSNNNNTTDDLQVMNMVGMFDDRNDEQ